MPKGNLAYSAAACDVLPLFRGKPFRLLIGGGGKAVECADARIAIGSAQEEGAALFTPPTLAKRRRIPGLNSGTIHLGEDFNEPLPDEFWLGIE